MTISDQKEDFLDVVNTAEMLGIFLKDIEVGRRGMSNINQSEDHQPKKKTEKKKDKFEIKKEVDISLTLNEENTPKQEFIDQGMTFKDELSSSSYPDS